MEMCMVKPQEVSAPEVSGLLRQYACERQCLMRLITWRTPASRVSPSIETNQKLLLLVLSPQIPIWYHR